MYRFDKEKIIEFRVKKGLIPAEMARELGISREQVRRYEAGICKPGIKKLLDMCELFGVAPGDFFVREGVDVVDDVDRVDRVDWLKGVRDMHRTYEAVFSTGRVCKRSTRDLVAAAAYIHRDTGVVEGVAFSGGESPRPRNTGIFDRGGRSKWRVERVRVARID